MSRATANLLLLLAALCWGSGNVAQKTILADIGPFTAIGFRCLLACLSIAPFCWWKERPKPPRVRAAPWELPVILALFAASVTLMQIGYGGTSVTNAGFLVNTTTVMTPIIAWALFRDLPNIMLAPAVVMTLIGIALLGGGEFTALTWGDYFSLAAAFAFSMWIVLLGRYVERTGRPLFVSVQQFAATGMVCMMIGLAVEPVSLAAVANAAPEILYLAIVSTAIPYALQAIAQQYTSSSIAAVLMSAEALFGAIAAQLLLGEFLTPVAMLGAALLMAGILVVQAPVPRLPQRRVIRPQPRLVTVAVHGKGGGNQLLPLTPAVSSPSPKQNK
jgi:drug/metabolite transporter (DMT)-like permease